MVSDRTRNEVWTGLLNVERTCRYYEQVHARATWWTITLRVLILLAVAGGVTAILDLLPLPGSAVQWMKAALAFAITGLTIGDVVANFPKKAAIAQVIYTQCAKLRLNGEKYGFRWMMSQQTNLCSVSAYCAWSGSITKLKVWRVTVILDQTGNSMNKLPRTHTKLYQGDTTPDPEPTPPEPPRTPPPTREPEPRRHDFEEPEPPVNPPPPPPPSRPQRDK